VEPTSSPWAVPVAPPRPAREERRPAALAALGVVLAALAAAAWLVLTGEPSYDAWGAVFVAPAIVLVSLPVLVRQAEREGDRRLLALLVAALLLKLAGSVVRHYVAFSVYGGVADAAGYDGWGTRIAERFWHGRFSTGLDSLTGTNFIRFLTGLVYTAIGPTRLGGFLVYSWLGFWGLFSFYRAFTIAVPEGRARSYAHLVLFIPSLVFWPSSIGKEAWMTFSLGVAALGAARLLAGRTVRGLAVLGLGLWLAALVRPHVAGLVALAVVAGFLLRRPREELRQLAFPAKALALCAVVVLAGILVVRTERFLQLKEYSPRGIREVFGRVSQQTGQGGSEFAPSIVDSPLRTPVAAGTVLFRPLLFDAHNLQALVAAFEGTFLLLLCLFRYRWGLAALRSVRRQPYLAFAAAYTVGFIVAFSSVANFGLLARERVQLLPVFLALLAVPPPEERGAGAPGPAEVAGARS
jgi:hypothetical protein